MILTLNDAVELLAVMLDMYATSTQIYARPNFWLFS